MADMTVLDYAMMVEDSHVETRIIEYRKRDADPGATERLGNFLRQHGELTQLREHLEEVVVEPESATAGGNAS